MNPIIDIAAGLDIIDKKEYVGKDTDITTTIAVAKQVLQALAQQGQMIQSNFKISINTSASIFDLVASIGGPIVRLTPLYFISPSFVLDFFSGPDDPKLNDETLLQQFADKVAEKCGIEPKKVSWKDRMNLRLYLTALQKQEKIRNTISFILVHELGHSHHDHSMRKHRYEQKFTSGVFWAIDWATLGLFKKIALDRQSRKHEAEADAFAYKKTVEYAEGGIHLFKSVTKFKPKGFIEKIAYFIFCLSTVASHGTYTMRLKTIQKHKKSGAFD